jgi:Holliday junction resolvase RusA-like endonuclease
VLLHTTRPDCSNLVKLVEDALQPWAIADDALVVRIAASKCYGAEARSFVAVEELS